MIRHVTQMRVWRLFCICKLDFSKGHTAYVIYMYSEGQNVVSWAIFYMDFLKVLPALTYHDTKFHSFAILEVLLGRKH
jgi:hypothetical protein